MRAAKLKPETRRSEAGGQVAESNDLLTQEEIAARLKVTVRTVARLQSEGVVPFILLGKSVRFYWPAVVSHLNTNSTVCRCVSHRPPTLRDTGPHGPPLRRATGPTAVDPQSQIL